MKRKKEQYPLLTFDVLPKAHGRGNILALATGLLLHHIVITGLITGRAHLFLLPLLVAWRQLFGEGKHGEDDQKHGYGTQEKATPPERRKQHTGTVKARNADG